MTRVCPIPVSAYRRVLRKKLGLRGKRLEAAAQAAAKWGDVKRVLHAAAYVS